MSEKKDLTRIEDLSEYLHQLDPETDKIFEETQKKIETGTSTGVSADTGSITAESLEEDSSDFSSDDNSEDVFAEAEDSNSFESDKSFDGDDDTSADFGSEEQETDFAGSDFESTDDDQDSFDSDESFEENDDEVQENDFSSEDSFESFEEKDSSYGEQPEEISTIEEDPEETQRFEGSSETTASFEEKNPQPETQEIFEETPPEPKQEANAPAAETFEDVRSFAQNISYTSISSGGNPPYSIMLKNIRFSEDAEDISETLKEFGILNDNSKKDIEQGLQNGALLISQISEYSAIFLAHKLRRFDLQISVGLSEELHPSQSYGANSTGLVSKESLYQNHEEEINLEEAPASFESILVATTPTLDNYQIVKYIDVATEHSTIDEIDLREDDDNLPQVYQVMAEKLKKKALSLHGNAIVGLNYQITPLPLRQYKVSCSGNIVWAQRRSEQVE